MPKNEDNHPIQFDTEGKRVEFDGEGKPKTQVAGPSGEPVGAEPIPVGPDGEPLPFNPPELAPNGIPQRPQDEAPGGVLNPPAPAPAPVPAVVANPSKANVKPR